ncbi:MAG TPA: hypothetical protein VD994_00465 [Prosthecobacter sp.]|nr:hypothetical protein [Prosthecobacter sp.]
MRGPRRPTEEQIRIAILRLRSTNMPPDHTAPCKAVADFLERDLARVQFDNEVARYSRERNVSLALARSILKSKKTKVA